MKRTELMVEGVRVWVATTNRRLLDKINQEYEVVAKKAAPKRKEQKHGDVPSR